tara:strand:- start:17157 stop:19841 length:2685 start_codon:yes stop_codon:yes gene_type:complete
MAPELDMTNYKALANLSPTLTSMFNAMAEDAEQEAGKAAQTNQAKLFNLTLNQTTAVLHDPDDPKVKEYLKQNGVEYWNNPITRNSALLTLGQRALDMSPVPSVLSSAESVEQISRARMEAGPDPVKQQQAGFNKALELAGPAYEDVLNGIDSDIAKGAFRERLEIAARAANEAAVKIQSNLHIRDTKESIHSGIQSIVDLGQNLAVLEPSMVPAMVKDWGLKLTLMKKQHPAYDIRKFAIESLEAQADRVASMYDEDDAPFLALEKAMRLMAKEKNGVLSTAENEFKRIRQQMQSTIDRRAREQGEAKAPERRAKIADVMGEVFAKRYDANTVVTDREALSMMMENPTIQKMLKSKEIRMTDLRAESKDWASGRVESRRNSLVKRLTSEILNDKNGKNYRNLAAGAYGESFPNLQAQFDDLTDEQLGRLAALYSSFTTTQHGRDVDAIRVDIGASLKPLYVGTQTVGSVTHNEDIKLLEQRLLLKARDDIEEGLGYDVALKNFQQSFAEAYPQLEKTKTSLRNSENWASIKRHPTFAHVVTESQRVLQEESKEQVRRLGKDQAVPFRKQNYALLQQTSLHVQSALPKLRALAVEQIRDEGGIETGPAIEERVAVLASDEYNRFLDSKMEAHKTKLDKRVAQAARPGIREAQDDPAAAPTEIQHTNLLETTDERLSGNQRANNDLENKAIAGVLAFHRTTAARTSDEFIDETDLFGQFLPGAATGFRHVFGSELEGATLGRGRKTREVIAANAVIKRVNRLRLKKNPSMLSNGEKKVLGAGVMMYGLDAKTIATGIFNGMPLKDMFDEGTNWRHEINPKFVMLFDGPDELDSFMKLASVEGAEEQQAFQNIGFDLSKLEDRQKLEAYQSKLFELTFKDEKATKFIRDTRAEFLQ